MITIFFISAACASSTPTKNVNQSTQQDISTKAVTSVIYPSETPQPTHIPTQIPTPSPTVNRCVPASELQLAVIQDGLDDISRSNFVKAGWAVKSTDFKNVWIVAAMIYGPGMEKGVGPGIWAISGDPDNPGIILSVDNYAKEFSIWPDASKTSADIRITADGVGDTMRCALND